MQLPPQPKIRRAGIPAGYVNAPLYGAYGGHAVFSEITIPKAQFEKGFNYRDLTALPGHTIDHVDIEYEPHGHEGMPIPHYDIHAYYVSHDARLAYCPAGGSHA